MVLVVDDDAHVVAALRDELAKHGLGVDMAATAETAAVLLDENVYCGLVLDLVLGRGSGFDVLQHISKKELKVPTIVVTGKLPSYVREMLDADHVKLVFPKPVEPRLLSSVVLGLCGITR
ncbi:MAG TPA: response regulator [Thermoanaerobaculia bacterium]|jgi:DNA-binding NtrC family response regulator